MPSSSDQTRVGRTLTLGGGAESSLEGRDIELSVSPKDIRTSPYDLCANRSDRRQSREGDRWFESTSLHRRVINEPHGEVTAKVSLDPAFLSHQAFFQMTYRCDGEGRYNHHVSLRTRRPCGLLKGPEVWPRRFGNPARRLVAGTGRGAASRVSEKLTLSKHRIASGLNIAAGAASATGVGP